MISLKEIISSEEFVNNKAKLPVILGINTDGDSVIIDLTKTPHLLIGGTSKSGKSVGINTILTSLLFKFSSDQVRFLLINPKKTELSLYNGIPHLITPVITDMKKAVQAFQWCINEMERRYMLLISKNVRDIESYNQKIQQEKDKICTPLSYLVVIVDEFSDLIMADSKHIEEYIICIAQKARAVGIHLILTTQVLSLDIITPVIKANIPSRIAFTTSTQIESCTILDETGAEQLSGLGDMLYVESGTPSIKRVHGAFISHDEIMKITDVCRSIGKPKYLEEIINT